MSKISKKKYCELLDELAAENCKCEYCFLKRFLQSLHPDPKILVEIKCIEKLKYELSSNEEHDVGWNGAGITWAKEGWAEIFREEFDEDLTVREIWAKVKARMK